MYPRVPPDPTGRESLEWYQIVAMRYRNPAVYTYGEPDDIWDKLRNPDADEFLTKADYEKILLALQNNLCAQGAGKRNVNMAAERARANQRPPAFREIAAEQGSASSNDPRPQVPPAGARANIHPYLETVDKSRGKGTRLLHRDPWNRRGVPRQRDTASEQSTNRPASTHSSMPDLVEPDDDVVIVEA